MNEEGLVVYCRFGRDYLSNLMKQAQSVSNNPSLAAPTKQIATYLINVKKLIRDHNIESESKDFTRLNTIKGKIDRKREPPPIQYYFPNGPADKTLVFESRFETGNLLAAVKLSDLEYDLVLQNDINTNGHTQWYFFRVANTRKGQTVRFNMLNLCKPDSLYNYGMKILCFSTNARHNG